MAEVSTNMGGFVNIKFF